MNKAIQEAQHAFDKGEIPIGAVIVLNGQIIARSHNLTETLNDVTAHAEMQAITAAANFFGAKYLNQCTLYVTLEPCPMCVGALYWSQIGIVVYGAQETRHQFNGQSTYHPKTKVFGGVMAEPAEKLIHQFFELKRSLN
jgi:tRNA(adenine34) deaminase